MSILFDTRDDVVEIADVNSAAGRRNGVDGELAFGHDLLPMIARGVLQIGAEDAAVGSIPIGGEDQRVAREVGIKFGLDVFGDGHDGAIVLDVFHIDFVFLRRHAVGDDQHQPAAVF